MTQIDGVEARGAGCDRLEQCCPKPLGPAHAPPLGLLELIEEKVQKAACQQNRGGGQNYLRLEPHGTQMPFVLPEVLPGHKADAAQHDEQNDGNIDQAVSGI